MTAVTGHFSYWQLLFLVAWVLAYRLTAATTDDLEAIIAQAVIDALHAAHVSRKEAAGIMGIHPTLLDRQLRAEPLNHLSLSRLARLGIASPVFWVCLCTRLAYLVVQRRMEEISDAFRMRS